MGREARSSLRMVLGAAIKLAAGHWEQAAERSRVREASTALATADSVRRRARTKALRRQKVETEPEETREAPLRRRGKNGKNWNLP